MIGGYSFILSKTKMKEKTLTNIYPRREQPIFIGITSYSCMILLAHLTNYPSMYAYLLIHYSVNNQSMQPWKPIKKKKRKIEKTPLTMEHILPFLTQQLTIILLLPSIAGYKKKRKEMGMEIITTIYLLNIYLSIYLYIYLGRQVHLAQWIAALSHSFDFISFYTLLYPFPSSFVSLSSGAALAAP
ncbi:hypothetical protein I7I50_01532 [Histoplasma capsulatum G186AR]|uniref:Uncharacterized protein n=1 Tax=Ajellomyces capsulatus TaxID=5037 RepID=A0A8H7YD00_AJECA|nr:hypothetical protein I7I52_12648 [Histoplasma capsulatum]QSS73387.1 hypothetical protein I7I50_01532 [Histoplasma capsulatum G186AR]